MTGGDVPCRHVFGPSELLTTSTESGTSYVNRSVMAANLSSYNSSERYGGRGGRTPCGRK